jgi:1,4-alpha-glucan branching enzyme
MILITRTVISSDLILLFKLIMKKQLGVLLLLVFGFSSFAQKASIDPTITPTLFRYNDQITVSYDATGTSLAGLTTAYIWVWIPGVNVNAKYNINPATPNADAAKFTKSVAGGKTIFTITFKPSDFFDADISTQTKLGMLIKGPDWANGQSNDFVADFWDGGFQIKLTSPTQRPLFVVTNDVVHIEAETPNTADFDLYVNNILIDEKNATKYQYDHIVTETSGSATVRLVATAGANTSETSFQYLIGGNSPEAARPPGIISGINYNLVDPMKVTLCILAPGKLSAYVRGDFSDWDVKPEYLMKRDGEFFWIELSGLTSGQEYGFQYLIDQTLFVADPYADKILDPDDQYIPAATYPGLKPYPQKAYSDSWYYNRVAVFQTAQVPYPWQTVNYSMPAKQDLVIYELHIRDFFADGKRNYQNLIDTIGYFKRLGINAIELMPVMEFAGNDSWGYNPTFMFAPDKYYGTKNKMKEFVDRCHAEGVAVILDIAMNHQDMPNPYVMMDFNFGTFKVNPTNKWFNVNATHPFSVFFDMNHESPYTQQYLDTINYHWLNEYKVDGFRFDLSKGFTQKNNPDNVNAWSSKDDSRIAILKRMSDKVRAHSPNALLILEHFADNSEEKILSDYGFMLWGNSNYAFAQNSMGVSSDSDVSWASYKSRTWSEPNLVSYMESHDEERMMYRNKTSGGASGNYNVKDTNTGLERVKAAATYFFAIPGPKMIWQFEELGYDVSIDFNGRTGAKPIHWEYFDDAQRHALYDYFSFLINLKKSKKIFETSDITLSGGNDLVKQITLKNDPYTTAPDTEDNMNAQVVVNFALTTQFIQVKFPHIGKWYNISDGQSINVTQTPYNISLPAGAYRIFVDYTNGSVVAAERNAEHEISFYPNPVKEKLELHVENGKILGVTVINIHGQEMNVSHINDNAWDTSNLTQGFYIAAVRTTSGIRKIKFIKQNN